MPTIAIAVTHEQEQALARLVAQLGDPFTGQPISLDHVLAAMIDDLAAADQSVDSDDGCRALVWLRGQGFFDGKPRGDRLPIGGDATGPVR